MKADNYQNCGRRTSAKAKENMQRIIMHAIISNTRPPGQGKVK